MKRYTPPLEDAAAKSRRQQKDEVIRNRMPSSTEFMSGRSRGQLLPVRFTASPGGDGMDMVHNFYTGENLLLPEILTSLLYELEGFNTPEGHLLKLQERGWRYQDPGIITAALRQLADRKLLLSEADIVQAVRNTALPKDIDTSITTIAWPTRSRPELLERGVKDFTANNQKYGRHPTYVILDDERGSSLDGPVAGVLRRIACEQDITVGYAGDKEKRLFIDFLEKSCQSDGLPRDLLEFALYDTKNNRIRDC